ncbi:MOSC domain-containing protein [Streptomyces sp. NPDC101062]|uniref:MOSC domain-containing protein n=1 Tax=unclassified Streptomyces TaxID=2593676 RepID=UPI002E799AD3|nr:MOSC domain-containing protein [Streptomyces sp. JV176]MEE1801269.1 MOSC domain-containing protein [Streptomyces sp. JV176]
MPKPLHAALHALGVHPVKSMAGCTPGSAVVEPWGLAGDRRWALVDRTGKVVTQRQRPGLALVRAEPLPGGGIRLSGPGPGPVDIEVPEPHGAVLVVADIFGTKVESVPAGPASWEVDRRLSAYLGEEVRLVHLDDPATRRPVDPLFARPGETVSFADGFPLLVTTTASLDALNTLIAHGDHPDEGPLPMDRFRPNLVVSGTDAWAEDGWRRLAVGEVTFRIAKPCGRCVITTTDQRTAERGREPLRTLGRHRRIDGKLVFGQNLVPESTGTVRVGDPVTVLE